LGELVLALNGKEYTLDAGMTVIADDAGVHDCRHHGRRAFGLRRRYHRCPAGNRLFHPERIAATGRKLNLTSDARSRFERGVDPFLDTGLDLLTGLVLEICGGEAGAWCARVKRLPRPRLSPMIPPVATLGGVAIAPDEQKRILAALGFAWRMTGGHRARLAPGCGWRARYCRGSRAHPRHRQGGKRPAARADGVARPTATPAQKLERRCAAPPPRG
jgi:phenylalanyl-tRNA synthetase beta chain